MDHHTEMEHPPFGDVFFDIGQVTYHVSLVASCYVMTSGKTSAHTHITLFVLTVWFLKMEFRTSFSNRSANAYAIWKEERLLQTLPEKKTLWEMPKSIQ